MPLCHGRPGVAYVPVEGDEPPGYGLMWWSDRSSRTIELFARTAHEVAQAMARAERPSQWSGAGQVWGEPGVSRLIALG